MLRFLYLNIYNFVLVFAGALALAIPLQLISKWFWILKGIAALYFFGQAINLFSTWQDKLIKREILIGKNKNEFRPDTFEIFMQAPCGRLLVRSVLSELGKSHEYKNLLKMKKPLLINIRDCCKPVETSVFVNEEALYKDKIMREDEVIS